MVHPASALTAFPGSDETNRVNDLPDVPLKVDLMGPASGRIGRRHATGQAYSLRHDARSFGDPLSVGRVIGGQFVPRALLVVGIIEARRHRRAEQRELESRLQT